MNALGSLSVDPKCTEVLAVLRKNREQHIKTLAEAREGYRKRAIAALEKKVAQLREGRNVSVAVNLQPPIDYTQEYDLVISMLELHTKETIQLDASQSRCLLHDDWGWKSAFVSSTAQYLSKANEADDD